MQLLLTKRLEVTQGKHFTTPGKKTKNHQTPYLALLNLVIKAPLSVGRGGQPAGPLQRAAQGMVTEMDGRSVGQGLWAFIVCPGKNSSDDLTPVACPQIQQRWEKKKSYPLSQ